MGRGEGGLTPPSRLRVPSLRRVYVVNKEICVRTVCAHEELLRGRKACTPRPLPALPHWVFIKHMFCARATSGGILSPLPWNIPYHRVEKGAVVFHPSAPP